MVNLQQTAGWPHARPLQIKKQKKEKQKSVLVW
jgi:hypothetical protein